MKERKSPQRMCIACRQMFDKQLLVRIVKKSDGTICLDEKGKADGRGAYLCHAEQCIAKFKKMRLLNRAWKTDVPMQVYERLEEVFVAKE